MVVKQLFIINYYARDSVFSLVLILKKIFSPSVKVTTFKKTYQPLPPNYIPSTFRITGVRKVSRAHNTVSRAHNTACMLFSGRIMINFHNVAFLLG